MVAKNIFESEDKLYDIRMLLYHGDNGVLNLKIFQNPFNHWTNLFVYQELEPTSEWGSSAYNPYHHGKISEHYASFQLTLAGTPFN
jgi:hypothetical protein